MKAVWIALGVVALGGVGYGLYWALKPPARSGGGGGGAGYNVHGAQTQAAVPATSKAAGAQLPNTPAGGVEASSYVRVVGDAFGAIQGALGGLGGGAG